MRHPRLLAAALGASLLAAGALAGTVTTRAHAGGSSGTLTSTTATTAAGTTASAGTPSLAIADGVSIGGVPVGGMTPGQAAAAVSIAYLAPITLQIGQHRFQATARQLGFHVYTRNPVRVAFAIGRTSHAAPGDIPVVTRLAGTGMRRYVQYLQTTFHRDAVDAKYVRNGTAARVIPDVWGRDVNKLLAVPALLAALRDVSRAGVSVPTTVVKPAVPARKVGPALIVDRGQHHVRLWIDGKLVRRAAGRRGPARVSDADGRVLDRRHAAQPDLDAAELRVGGRREADRARPGQPARHALDGHLGARRRPPRHAGRGLDRLQRLARLHPDAHSRRRVAVRPRRRRRARLDHRLGTARRSRLAA